jgi:hypothetical protein
LWIHIEPDGMQFTYKELLAREARLAKRMHEL